MRHTVVVGVLFATGLVRPSAGAAHPNYEHVERTVRESDGREWHLVKHFSDGIIFYDPVKLIVRDSTGAAVAETEFSRNVCVVGCGVRCVVYRYVDEQPLLAVNVWRLEGGKLQPADSMALHALGAIVPLVDDPVSYVVAVVFFYAPFVVFAVLGRVPWPRARMAMQFGAFLATVPYLFSLAYALLLLSHLSWAIVVFLLVAVGVAWVRRIVRRPNNELQLTRGVAQMDAPRS